MTWIDLREEVEGLFSELENTVEVRDLIEGFHQWDPESRKARDKAYDAKRKGRVRTVEKPAKTKAAAPKTDRKAYKREYMRAYMQKRRAAAKKAA